MHGDGLDPNADPPLVANTTTFQPLAIYSRTLGPAGNASNDRQESPACFRRKGKLEMNEDPRNQRRGPPVARFRRSALLPRKLQFQAAPPPVAGTRGEPKPGIDGTVHRRPAGQAYRWHVSEFRGCVPNFLGFARCARSGVDAEAEFPSFDVLAATSSAVGSGLLFGSPSFFRRRHDGGVRAGAFGNEVRVLPESVAGASKPRFD